MDFEANGWLYLKNTQTSERVKVPACARLVERQTTQTDPQRFNIVYFLPQTGIVGDWDSQRIAAFKNDLAENLKIWQPAGFAVTDPILRQTLEKQCTALLAQNDAENSKGIIPERRIKRIRFDEVLRGWNTDLIWEPFYGLSNSVQTVLDAASSVGYKNAVESSVWLAQAQTHKNMGAGAENKTALGSQAAEQTQEAPAPNRQTPNEALAGVAVPATADPDGLFGQNALASFAHIAMQAAKGLNSSAASAPSMQSQEAHTPASAQPTLSPDHQEPVRAPSDPTSAKLRSKPIKFTFFQLPTQHENGAVAWDDGMFKADSYLTPEAFSAVKSFIGGSFKNEKEKDQMLYTAEVFQALDMGGFAFELDGFAPLDRHYAEHDGQKVLDPQNFIFAAAAASPFPGAKNFALLAKARILSDRLHDAALAACETEDDAQGGEFDEGSFEAIANYLGFGGTGDISMEWNSIAKILKVNGIDQKKIKRIRNPRLLKAIENNIKQLSSLESLPRPASTQDERLAHRILPEKISIKQKKHKVDLTKKPKPRDAKPSAGKQAK